MWEKLEAATGAIPGKCEKKAENYYFILFRSVKQKNFKKKKEEWQTQTRCL